MSAELINYKQVENKIVTIRGHEVILDSDIAELYGVETKRINEAVSNNPEKFPIGYIFELSDEEYKALRSKFSTLDKTGRGQHTKYLPQSLYGERFIYACDNPKKPTGNTNHHSHC